MEVHLTKVVRHPLEQRMLMYFYIIADRMETIKLLYYNMTCCLIALSTEQQVLASREEESSMASCPTPASRRCYKKGWETLPHHVTS